MKRVIDRIMKSIGELSNRLLVITSLQASDYASLAMPKFEKRIMLSAAERRRLNAEAYNASRSSDVILTERDLKLVKQ